MTAVHQEDEELITENFGLVGMLVQELLGRAPSQVRRDDLTSAGLTALVQAGHTFDASLGVPFRQYATLRIRGALVDEMRRTDWTSRSVRRRTRNVTETRNSLTASLGRPPSDAEFATSLGVPVEVVSANDDALTRANVISLDSAFDRPLGQLVPSRDPVPEMTAERRQQVTYLKEAIAELPERLQAVVTDYFLTERPLAELAEQLGVTESRVSQMRAEALLLLRDALNHALDTRATVPVGRAGRPDRVPRHEPTRPRPLSAPR